ncbi:AEC family transporter [Metabacillus mangrovi]|nr:AEC family transporter [Metabacillus mangrovi]
MSIIQILTPVFTMAAMAAAGFVTSRFIEITAETRRFISFTAINFALPAVVVSSIFQLGFNRETWISFAAVYTSSLCFTLFGMLAGYLAGKGFGYGEMEARQLAIVSGCGNTGFVGIPLIALLFGPEAGSYAAVYDAGTMTSVFTVGILLLRPEKFSFRQLKAILNTPFITLLSAVLLAALGVALPVMLLETADMLSGLAAPLALILIGLLIPTISKADWKRVQNGYKRFMAAALVIKVLLLPAIACAAVWLLPFPESLGQIVIVQASMPTFTLAAVLFERYIIGGAKQFGIVALICTTAFSLLMLPVTVWVAQAIS